jgi:hypothetical protein
MTITLTGEAIALCIRADVHAVFSRYAATHASEPRFSRWVLFVDGDRSLESIKMLMVTAQESQCETPISSSFGCSTLARRCAAE